MSEKRKSALVTYLALLFGIAFVIVSISLIVQLRKGNDPNQSAIAANVAALQSELQELKAENEELKGLQEQNLRLQEQVDALQVALKEAQSDSEYLEGNAYNAQASAGLKDEQLKAYDLLTKAQYAYVTGDAETLRSAAKELAGLYTHLSNDAKDAYFMLLEYMEQPYLGTGTTTKP